MTVKIGYVDIAAMYTGYAYVVLGRDIRNPTIPSIPSNFYQLEICIFEIQELKKCTSGDVNKVSCLVGLHLYKYGKMINVVE